MKDRDSFIFAVTIFLIISVTALIMYLTTEIRKEALQKQNEQEIIVNAEQQLDDLLCEPDND